MYIYVYMSLYLSLSLPLSPTLSLSRTHTHTHKHTHTRTHTHRRTFVVNFRHLVLARIKTPKKSCKISESAVSDTLLMSGFQIFAPDAAFQNRALRDFWYALNQKSALSFPDFARKPGCSSDNTRLGKHPRGKHPPLQHIIDQHNKTTD